MIRYWVRRLARSLIAGAALVGAAWSCGAEMPTILRAMREARARDAAEAPLAGPPCVYVDVHHEAVVGIAALEHYLVAVEQDKRA